MTDSTQNQELTTTKLTPDFINKLNADFVNIGSWLNSISSLPDDLALPYLLTLKTAVSQMQKRVEAVEVELRAADIKNPD